MKYKLKDFAADNGLTMEKNACYGIYGGYYVHVKYSPLGNPRCLISVVTRAEEKKGALEKFLARHAKEMRLADFGVVGIGLMVAPKFTGEVFGAVKSILDKIVAHLAREKFPGADVCPYCGEPLDGKTVLMTESDIRFRAHERCYGAAYAAAKAKASAELKSDKKILGLLGALLGAVLAGGIFVLMYIWCRFGAIAALFAPILSAYFYKKFGGKDTPFKLVSSCTLGTASVIGSFLLGLYIDGRGEGGWSYVLENLRSDGFYLTFFILNIVFSVLLLAGAYIYVFGNYKRSEKNAASRMNRLD